MALVTEQPDGYNEADRIYPVPHTCTYCEDITLTPPWREYWDKKLQEEPLLQAIGAREPNGEDTCLFWRFLRERYQYFKAIPEWKAALRRAEEAGIEKSIYPSDHLCPTCEGYLCQARTSGSAKIPLPSVWQEALAGDYSLGLNASEAINGARLGCRFWQYALHPKWPDSDSVRLTMRVYVNAWGLQMGLPGLARWSHHSLASGHVDFKRIGKEDEYIPGNPMPPFVDKEVEKAFWTPGLNGGLNFFSPAESDPTSRFFGEPPNINPCADTTFDAVRTWLEDCDRGHEVCNGATKKFMPKRLLRVPATASGIHQLVDVEGHERYAALSYCWGGNQTFKTTTANLPEYMRTVPIDKLGSTISDATRVARKLGIGYLWIDSICIVQDSPNECSSEINKMTGIYASAYVTIAAGNVKSNEESFLKVRHEALIFKAKFQCPDGTIGSVLLQPEYDWRHDEDPLNDRAWTYQEAFLSRRILYFGPRQLFGTCLQEPETMFDGGVGPHGHGLLDVKRHVPTQYEDYPPESWWETVQEFSRRKVTFPADRMNAISGVARVVQNSLNDDYVVGLWRSTLITDLLWYPNFSGIDEDHWPVKRPSVYCGPSWSWASMEGMIKHNPPFADSGLPTLEVIGTDVTLASSLVPFGSVSAATLQVRGLLFPVSDFHTTGYPPTTLPFCRVIVKSKLKSGRSHFVLDCKVYDDDVGVRTASYVSKKKSCRALWVLEVWRYVPVWELFDQRISSKCLILAEHHSDGTFRRVGAVDIHEHIYSQPGWLASSETREITIV